MRGLFYFSAGFVAGYLFAGYLVRGGITGVPGNWTGIGAVLGQP